jgi:hypothetical protein
MSFVRNVFLVMLLGAIVVPTTSGFTIKDSAYLQTNISSLFTDEGSLSGYVHDTFMNPIPGALIRVSYHSTYQENYSDASGFYHVTNIPICYCMKNATCSKQGYQTTWILLSISENTTYDFTLASQNLTCYPVFNGTLGIGGCYISCVNVSFVADENVDSIFYQVDTAGWNQYTTPFQINEDGNHIFSWYWIYQGNLSAECQITLTIERTIPTLTVSSERIQINMVKVTAVAADEPSGINRVEFYLDGELSSVDTTGPYTGVVFGIDSHEVEVVAFDNAGNSVNDTIVTSYRSQSVPHTLHPFLSRISVALGFIQHLHLFSDGTIRSFLFT